MTKVSPLPSKETPTTATGRPSVRRCLVSGEVKPKSELVRFVLDPSNNVVPDIAGKLPGRGLWVSADAESIDSATKKNLFSKAAKTKVVTTPDLSDQVARLLARRCRDLLGLAKAAGAVIAREKMVEEALVTRSLDCVLLASDAGQDIKKKMAGVPDLFNLMSRDELSAALGRENCAVAGLRFNPLSDKLKQELTRWQGVKSSPLTPNGSSDLI